jgi:hypothetical protein
MQLAWAEAVRLHTGRPVLILAPLAVAPQTVAEGAEIGVAVKHCRDGSEIPDGACIVITNYDRLHRFDPSMFGAVVLDESSCIKHHDAKTLRTLLTAFRDTPFKLCATATPAPNDWTELGTHAEFLGVCTRAEMLAELMRLKSAVAIAGTHGKTTTTTMVASLLEAGGFDPTVINGGIINAYGANAELRVWPAGISLIARPGARSTHGRTDWCG